MVVILTRCETRARLHLPNGRRERVRRWPGPSSVFLFYQSLLLGRRAVVQHPVHPVHQAQARLNIQVRLGQLHRSSRSCARSRYRSSMRQPVRSIRIQAPGCQGTVRRSCNRSNREDITAITMHWSVRVTWANLDIVKHRLVN